MVVDRIWSMPNKNTFNIKPVKELLIQECTSGLWIDPFSNNNTIKKILNGSYINTITNDLNPNCDTDYHLDALEFLKMFEANSIDGVVYDPPYSPRQISECYQGVGLTVSKETTQSSFWSKQKDEIARILKPGGKVISFGWNSQGCGKTRGFNTKQVLLVPHGGNHNDTICTVEVKGELHMNQLNLPEFKVIDVQSNEHDLLFTVESVEPPKACYECGSISYYKHGKTERFVRDLSSFGKRVGITVKGNRYKCRDCGATFSETYSSIDERDKITNRLRKHIKYQSLKQPFANIAEEFSISPTTVKRIFNEFVEQKERYMVFKAPKVLGIDEVHLNKQMRAVFTDIEGLKVLDMLKDRNKQTIINFLKKIPDKHVIEIVTTDMWQPYKDAINEVLPHAKQIVDKFHVIQYGSKAMESSRKAFRSTLTDKQRKQLMHDRFVLLKNKEDLLPQEQLNRDIWFVTFPTLKVAYDLKEGLRDMYLCETREEAEEYFKQWKKSIPDDMTAFKDVAKMINNWHTEIFNYFDNRLTNAFTESINNLIKHIEKRGRGYSFEVLRVKVLFGTKATNKPRFGEQGFTHMDISNYFNPPALTEGFGVSIPQLLEIIERDGF